MKQAEQPLYPKLSSIYNKILQLASAILLIVVLMNMWQATGIKNRDNLAEHFNYIAKQQLQQASVGTATIMAQEYDGNQRNKETLQTYINGLNEVDFIKQVHLYDPTGLLIASSQVINANNNNPLIEQDNESTENQNERLVNTAQQAKSINDLYGITLGENNTSDRYTPFVQEIRTDKLLGYLRFTIEQSYLTDILAKADEDQQALFRLMLLLAGFVGFLLTRGFNRFSRRSYRLKKAIEREKKIIAQSQQSSDVNSADVNEPALSAASSSSENISASKREG
ncbi:hypothetical protein KO495_13040 [Colwellia sp. D2M02]|uniref:hypothetical protein n=1 Tax=Colwellia sp. D2M02 TaxID=2841562 RepID=UPI001C08300D|nr:hypothetical protein [Colwellia sp. D2M02]MBU2894239.1 hypothetical protein [Colwellia sp. D2M02]